MPPEKKGAPGPAQPIPQAVCPSCKSPNEMGTLMCKKCGEILPGKFPKRTKAEEFDATEGGFSPTCIVVPALLLLCAVVFFFFAVRGGTKPGTCEHNLGLIGKAVYQYNKSHPENKMTNLDIEELLKPGKKGKPYLKDRPVCNVDSSAKYSFDTDGISVICSHRKK